MVLAVVGTIAIPAAAYAALQGFATLGKRSERATAASASDERHERPADSETSALGTEQESTRRPRSSGALPLCSLEVRPRAAVDQGLLELLRTESSPSREVLTQYVPPQNQGDIESIFQSQNPIPDAGTPLPEPTWKSVPIFEPADSLPNSLPFSDRGGEGISPPAASRRELPSGQPTAQAAPRRAGSGRLIFALGALLGCVGVGGMTSALAQGWSWAASRSKPTSNALETPAPDQAMNSPAEFAEMVWLPERLRQENLAA